MHFNSTLNQQRFTKTKLGLGIQENRLALDRDGFPSRERLLQEEKEVKKCGSKRKEDRIGQVFKETERKNKRLQSTSSQKKKKK